MKRLEIIGLCLIATLAGGGAAAASATAQQPEYRACVKVAKNPATRKDTGGYNNATCTEPNAAGEGKYTLQALVTPYLFEGSAGKATTLYYRTPGAGLAWEVECKKLRDTGVITSATEGTVNMTLESCKATDKAGGKAKPTACPSNLATTLESVLVDTLPGDKPGVVLYPGFAKPFECAGVTFGPTSGAEVGSVEDTGKGLACVFAVNAATGEQDLTGFYFEGEEYDALLQSHVAGAPLLDVGLATTAMLGPKEGVVVVN